MKKLLLLLLFIPLVISCTKDPIIYTLTTSANPSEGGTVSPSTQQYDEGKTATITATASSEYLFQSWSGATGSTNSTTVVMNSDKSVTANFVKKKYTLTTTVEGEGTVTEKVIKAGAATDYNSGTIVELTAVPSGEWLFVEWKGDVTGTENPTQITIDKAKSVTAVFVKKQYPLTIEIEGEGTVSEKVIKVGLATDYNSGTIVELTAEPTGDWEFVEWTGDISSTENPVQITIDKAKTVKAIFKSNLNILTQGKGNVEIVKIENGLIKLKANADSDENYVFKGWSGNYSGIENPIEINYSNDLLIKAVFVNQDLKNNLQERLSSGQETPLEIYNSDNSLLGELYGLFYQGGLISYLDTNNGVGFVVEPKDIYVESDPSDNLPWGSIDYVTQANKTSIFSGIDNTIKILEYELLNNIISASKYCYNLNLNGYDDWYLPSKDELNMILNNVHLNMYGNFEDESDGSIPGSYCCSGWYWSSSESESYGEVAWVQSFKSSSIGYQAEYDIGIKHFKNEVRAIRYFGTGYNFTDGGFASNITNTSAMLYTQGLNDCFRKDVIEKGFWVSKNEIPSKSNSQIYIDNTSGCNVIDLKADNLDSNTTYYFSFYVINQFGTFTSEIKSFTTLE